MRTPKILVLILSFVFIFSCENNTEAFIKNITVEEMTTLVNEQEVQILDVRTDEEVSHGTIPKAVHIDYYSPSFEQDVAKLDKDQPVLVYCKAGGRSSSGATKMKKLGFKKIYNLRHGYDSWIKNK